MRAALLALSCLVVAVCSAGCASARPAERAAVVDPLVQLEAGALSDHITDPMVSIRHQRGTSTHFRVVAVVYTLDGLLLSARRLDRTRPPEAELAVFDGRVRPGRHLLSVRLTLERFAGDRMSDDPLGRTQLETQHEFVLTEGQLAVITAYTREGALASTASLEVEVRFRPSRSD